MHDPMTQAFVIPNPFTGQNVPWRKRRYYEPLITIWHVDPEADGSDDSCDWHGWHSLTDAERDWLRKEGESEWVFMVRGVNKCDDNCKEIPGEFWEGGLVNASALELLCAIYAVIAWRMPDAKGNPLCHKPLSGWRHRRMLAAAFPHLLRMVTNSSDNLHRAINDARSVDDDGRKAMGVLFVAVYRIIKGDLRPWWRHPRWHVHHWSIRVEPWLNLTRWLTRRCRICGKRFKWGAAPVYDSRGYSHMDCHDLRVVK